MVMMMEEKKAEEEGETMIMLGMDSSPDSHLKGRTFESHLGHPVPVPCTKMLRERELDCVPKLGRLRLGRRESLPLVSQPKR